MDTGGIYEYTIANFGLSQAQRYLNVMHERFGDLARQPMLGRAASRLAPNLRRYEYRSHVVFYVPDPEGVLIVRVLHQSMDVQRHVMDDEEDA